MTTADNDRARRRIVLECEKLEAREVPAVATLAGTSLTVTGTAGDDRIRITSDGTNLSVVDGSRVISSFVSTAITDVAINTLGGNDAVVVDPNVVQAVTIDGGQGNNKLVAGGGDAVLTAGTGNDALFGGSGLTTFNADGGSNDLYKVMPTDIVLPGGTSRVLNAFTPGGAPLAVQEIITADEANAILQRAGAASASNDAIIVICDRNGRILGVRVEDGVAPEIRNNINNLVFAIDGAYAKALTGAYFGNNEAPLTSRTVQNISQSAITQREVQSNPSITDPNSTLRGPGTVAAVGSKGHFPPNVANTPQVDLFHIEYTNRDGTFHPGPDRIKGTADDVRLAQRFNIDPRFVPAGQDLTPPDSYGFQSGLLPTAQARGIGTLPGGIPVLKNGQSIGGLGVFFPGKTGFATEENSVLNKVPGSNNLFDPTKPDRSLEAEWIAFAALGGAQVAVGGAAVAAVTEPLGGVALPAGYLLPNGRIDLVGIQLEVFGPGGSVEGPKALLEEGNRVGRGPANSGANMPISLGVDGVLGGGDDVFLRAGKAVPQGWLVMPHDGNGVTAADANQITIQAIVQANKTRAAIRLPPGARAKFMIAVCDKDGNLISLFRQFDATIFSIDVSVAKARNVAYYNDPTQLLDIDQIPGVPKGTAFTARTFRFAGHPRFPFGIDDGTLPGPLSQLNDDPVNTNRFTGALQGPPAPASQYQSAVGYNAFNPGTNFHQQGNILNQNGVVFFPGSSGLYKNGVLVGGFGISGDGVDQDDVTTVGGQAGFDAPLQIRSDRYAPRGVKLPYQKFNRNPEA
jgi:uncharacterized protein GlcG (DUF336 family)